MDYAAEERKRKRLEAWRRKQQQEEPSLSASGSFDGGPKAKISMALSLSSLGGRISVNKIKAKKKKFRKSSFAAPSSAANPFDADDEQTVTAVEEQEVPVHVAGALKGEPTLWSLENITIAGTDSSKTTGEAEPGRQRSKSSRAGSRWDKAPTFGTATLTTSATSSSVTNDALDTFMSKLDAGAWCISTINEDRDACNDQASHALNIDLSGSMMSRKGQHAYMLNKKNPVSGGVITPKELQRWLHSSNSSSTPMTKTEANAMVDEFGNVEGSRCTHSGWGSEDQASGTRGKPATDDEEEEMARRAFIEALKSAPSFVDERQGQRDNLDDIPKKNDNKKPELAADVKTEKQRREQRLKGLEQEAEEARCLALRAGAPDLGRLYNDVEGGVMEEAERNLDAAMAAPDALTVLAELNKKKELKAVNHSAIEYIDINKNLYVVPRDLAKLTNDDVLNLRAKLKVRVRGHGAPAPISAFEHCGLSAKILKMLATQKIYKPFPVQAQCIPCIMAGRDVIGIAKTGSGKV